MTNKKDVNAENQNKTYEAWFNANFKKCICGAVVLVVAAAVIIAGVLICKQKNSAAKARLLAADIENVESIIAESPDHADVAITRMRIGNELLTMKKWKEAREQFVKISDIADAAVFLRDSARLAAASCLEQLNDFDAAAKEFAAIEADNSASVQVRSEAGYNAGRMMLKSGKISEAEKILQNVAAMTGSSPWIGLSRNTLIAIKNGDFAVPAAKKGK